MSLQDPFHQSAALSLIAEWACKHGFKEMADYCMRNIVSEFKIQHPPAVQRVKMFLLDNIVQHDLVEEVDQATQLLSEIAYSQPQNSTSAYFKLVCSIKAQVGFLPFSSGC